MFKKIFFILIVLVVIPLVYAGQNFTTSNYNIEKLIYGAGAGNTSTSSYEFQHMYNSQAQNSSTSSYNFHLSNFYLSDEPESPKPSIYFSALNPANEAITNNVSVGLYINITETNLTEIVYTWNNTDYNLYDEDLILYLPLNNESSLGENNTYVRDISPLESEGIAGRDLATENAAPIPNCKYDGCFVFDGHLDNIKIPYRDEFNLTGNNELTIATWVYFHNTHNYQHLVSLSSGAGTNEWYLRKDNGDKIHFLIYNGTDNLQVSGSIFLQENQWYHLAGTYNGSVMKVFVNAQEDGSLETTDLIVNKEVDLYIGAIGGAHYSAPNASIDAPLVSRRGFSEEEITQHYMSNLYKYDPDKWSLYLNQSKNSTDGLEIGNYTYKVKATNIYDSSNETEERTISINNTTPTQVVLVSPEDGNTTTILTPFFEWNRSTDHNKHPITYNFIIDNDSNFATPHIDTSTTNPNYTLTAELEVDTPYFWKVRAYDGYDYGAFSEVWNITVHSLIIISLPVDTIGFGELGLDDKKNTSSGELDPLLIQNDGNIPINIVITGEDLWDVQPNPSNYYQFRIEENETNAYTSATTTYTNVNQTREITDITNLNYSDISDSAELHLKIQVPELEDAGSKSSTITVIAE